MHYYDILGMSALPALTDFLFAKISGPKVTLIGILFWILFEHFVHVSETKLGVYFIYMRF